MSVIDPTRPASGPHGGDGQAIAAALGVDPASIIDLSASLNPFAPDVAAIAARHLDALGRYPDDTAATTAVARMVDVDVDRLVLTNGGAEAIAIVASEVVAGSIIDPEFSLYRRHLSRIDDSAPRWRSNPGNPLGRLAAAGDVASVWDEAFFPLAAGTWTRGDDASWRLGSLTKAWACPGLRIGYVIAPDAAQARAVRARRPQWSVGSLALAVIDEAIEQSDPARWSSSIRSLRHRFATDLSSLGHVVIDTECNWVLIEEAGDLRSRLIAQRVVVRDCASFGLAGTVRIALPRPTDYDAVLTAFANVNRN